MKEENCEVCYKIICKQCQWEASDADVKQIQCGKLTACPKCGWKPGDEISLTEKRKKITTFLQTNTLAVIATNTSPHVSPESALVAFVEDENFHLYFQTGKYTRKAKNLQENPLVSLVIGLTLEKMATIQYEGKATLLTDKLAIEACKRRFLEKKSPTTSEYLDRPDAIFYKVTPMRIRLSDYTSGSHATVMNLDEFKMAK